MNLPASFTNTGGEYWQINITYGDIVRVRQHVQGADGKPLDLCYIAETGNFRQVIDHIDVVVKCVYWLLYPQLKESYGLDGIALQEWFYNHIDCNTLQEMTKAWYEALLNFTPYPVIRSTMMSAGEMRTKAELIKAIEILAGALQECMSLPESLELTPTNTPTAN